MCYYDYIRFQCGCRYWGFYRKNCSEGVTQRCGNKRVYKHMYEPHGLYCKTHPYSRDTSSRVYVPLPEAVKHGCATAGCFLPANHGPPHQSWTKCTIAECHLHGGHIGRHGEYPVIFAAELARRYEEKIRQIAVQLQNLNDIVLSEMGKREHPEKEMVVSHLQELDSPHVAKGRYHMNTVHNASATLSSTGCAPTEESTNAGRKLHVLPLPRLAYKNDEQKTLYRPLNYQKQEIRLYELLPCLPSMEIRGRFIIEPLDTCPRFAALSYTWGPDELDKRSILVDDSRQMFARKNLWNFLRQQSSIIKSPKCFWIDAICINQDVVPERNHQVSMMKKIYTTASEVYIWLGVEAENSDDAMDWLIEKGSKKLRPHGPGYHPIWNRLQGKALVRLCERPYWRRMWIIQEIVHAERIVLWCGSKSVEWDVVENLYLTLKTLQNEAWDVHHESVLGVLQSAAAVMAWQRAHWRHPGVPAPRLQTLIEVFQDWQCKDVRDKVFALVSMADQDTAIEPDYSLTVREIFYAVQKNHADSGWKFGNLLSQLLGLSRRDITLLHGQQL
jgi:hypothetical protein